MRAVNAFLKFDDIPEGQCALELVSAPVCYRSQVPWTKAGLNPQSLCSDRILQGIYATGGDVRRICDSFGLSIAGASRYAATLGQPPFHEEIPVRRVRALSESVHDS